MALAEAVAYFIAVCWQQVKQLQTIHNLILEIDSRLNKIKYIFQQTLCSEIREECVFAMKCWGPSEKPVKLPHLNGNAHIEDLDDLEASQALKPAVMNTSFM